MEFFDLMNRLSFLVATLIAAIALPASAAVYRWVDAEGHVHYTDKAVENSEPVNIRTGQPNEKDATPTGADPNLTTDQLAQKKSECEQKRKQYESYASAKKIVETDGLGRTHEYSADEMKMLVEKTQQAMQQTCGAAGISTTTAAAPATGSTPPQ
ncbi:MAG TPA: DUF4124 domain-containing protein, partial [Nevskiaceae bacterium]|nr:DUF4124 domain-containing protein [Nevskiaceae bacterium]